MPNIPPEALYNACQAGDAAAVSRLLPTGGTPLNLSGPHYQEPYSITTPLHMAAMHGHTAIVRMILERAPNTVADVVCAYGVTALLLGQGLTFAHCSAQPKPFWSVSRCVSSL